MGYVAGLQVFEDPNLLIFKEHWTRRQTRKFKNKRWNKKYRKRYCKQVSYPDPNFYFDKMNNRLFGHPDWIKVMRNHDLFQRRR